MQLTVYCFTKPYGQRTSAGRDKVVWSTVVRQYQMLRPRSIVGADVLRFHKAALRLQGS